MQTESSTPSNALRIAVIPGDGIGKDVTAEAVKVIEAIGKRFGHAFELEQLPWSADHYLQTGVTIPANGYDTLREFDAIFIGALGDPRVPDNRHARDILLGTRFELDLYVNYRPVKLLHEPSKAVYCPPFRCPYRAWTNNEQRLCPIKSDLMQ